jgi:hypothetical protein
MNMHFFPEREAVKGANGLISSLVERQRTDVVVIQLLHVILKSIVTH